MCSVSLTSLVRGAFRSYHSAHVPVSSRLSYLSSINLTGLRGVAHSVAVLPRILRIENGALRIMRFPGTSTLEEHRATCRLLTDIASEPD